MVYLKDWTEFEAATAKLYAQAPAKVRYSVKFRPAEGKLVLKVTDNVKCLQYKTFSSIILNRFEALNLRLLTQMSNAQSSPSRAQIPSGKAAANSPASAADADADVDMDEPGTQRAGPLGGREGSVVPPSGLGGGAQQAQTPAGGQANKTGGGGKKKKKGKK